MAPKTHPCYVVSSDECGCKLDPRQTSCVQGTNDFVQKGTASQSIPYIKRDPVYTERRQRYEDSLSIIDKTLGPEKPTNDKTLQPISDVKLLQLKTFREQHRNECMSIINQYLYRFDPRTVSTQANNHRCRHRFIINNRNQLVPATVDDDGQSRCEVCGRAAEYLRSGLPRSKPQISSQDLRTPVIVIDQPLEKTVHNPKKIKPARSNQQLNGARRSIQFDPRLRSPLAMLWRTKDSSEITTNSIIEVYRWK